MLVARSQTTERNSKFGPDGYPAHHHLLQPPDWFVPQLSNHFTERDKCFPQSLPTILLLGRAIWVLSALTVVRNAGGGGAGDLRSPLKYIP